MPMDNRQKLDLVVRLRRRTRLRKIAVGVVIALLAGMVLAYAQYRHMA
jgi:hypothetical protein